MKKHLSTIALSSSLLLGAAAPANAQGNFGVGLGLFNGSTEYKDIDAKTYVLPVFTYESDHFSLSPTRAEYHIQISGNTWVSAIGALRLQGYEADKSKTFKGMDNRDIGFDLGASLNYYDEKIGFLSLEWLTDITETSEGDEVSAIWAYPFEGPTLTITPSVFARWQSEELVNYYYGVKTKEATTTRLAYTPKSASTYGAALSLDYKITQSIILFTEVSAFSLHEEVKNSPLVSNDKDIGFSLAAGLLYSF